MRADTILFAISLQSFIGFNPDALPLTGIDFTPAVIAAATGCVSLVLGALGHGTEVCYIGQGTITAIHTTEQCYLGKVFEVTKYSF